MAARIYTSVRIPPELLARVDAYAERNMVGRNLIVVRALEDKMDELEAAEKARDI